MEMLYSFNTCSSRLKNLLYVKIYNFGWKMRFFTISESNIRKKSKISLKGCSMDYKVAYLISGQYINK